MAQTVEHDQRGDTWLFKQEWNFEKKPSRADFEAYTKSLMICAQGDGILAPEEREWILGYTAAMGADPQLIAELETYRPGNDPRELISHSRVAQQARGACIYDAIRASWADGELAIGELAAIRRMAEMLGVPDLVDGLVELHDQERKLRAKRTRLLYPAGTPL